MSSHPTKPPAEAEVQPTDLTRLIHEISLMIARIFNRRMKESGLTRSQWQVLYQLNRKDGQTQTELAELLIIAKPPLGKMVDRLESEGWVERRADAADRRAKRVFLTEKAAGLIEPLENEVHAIACCATEHFSRNELETLRSLLLKVHCNLVDTDESHSG